MISWQSIMSVFNTKGTLLKWLKTLDQSLKDGVLESVSVNSVSEGIITLSFNFADGSVITTPQIDIPQGAQGPQGPQGVPGPQGPQGPQGEPGGTEVVANPTATGTQDLTSLQVGGTVYNIPQGSGGITNAEVIEYAEELPTASETSPNFVQTPDGTLYRKKAVKGGSLLGAWIFKDTLVLSGRNTFNISFTSNSGSYTEMSYITGVANDLSYGSEVVYSEVRGMGGWNNTAYKTIQITDVSSLKNREAFETWLKANATQQSSGGGTSVSYEYVAMQEVPTPTTADNGKVLGVTNGAYALQEAGGGGNDKYEQITNGGVHDEDANTITFKYKGDLSIYGEFFVTGSSSDGDGTTFLAMSAYIPFITGNGMVVPVEYSEFKNYMTSPTEKGTLYGVASVSKSSFELIVYNVPTAPDGVFGPGFYLYGKK